MKELQEEDPKNNGKCGLEKELNKHVIVISFKQSTTSKPLTTPNAMAMGELDNQICTVNLAPPLPEKNFIFKNFVSVIYFNISILVTKI